MSGNRGSSNTKRNQGGAIQKLLPLVPGETPRGAVGGINVTQPRDLHQVFDSAHASPRSGEP